jgi:hypothetical protein
MIVVAVVAFLFGSCAAEPESEPEIRSMPTLDESEYDGLTPEELRLRAEPMTLEEAERLGIVDTTIHIEYPMSPESIPLIPIDTGIN